MNKIFKTIGLVGLFIASFIVFLYLLFPYEVLKESIAKELSNSLDMDVRIGEVIPRKLSIGVTVNDIKLKGANTPELAFKSLGASIGILPLLFGNISASLEVEGTKNKFLRVKSSLGIFSLLGQKFVPKSVLVESKSFPIGGLVNFILTNLSNSPTVDPLIGPFLQQIEFGGDLQANIDMDLDSNEPTQSNGDLLLKMKNAFFRVKDVDGLIPDQSFSKAVIKASISNAVFKIDAKSSGFKSQDLAIDFNGSISLKPQLERSPIDVVTKVVFDGGLKEFVGPILPMAGAQSDSELSAKISGTLGRRNVTVF